MDDFEFRLWTSTNTLVEFNHRHDGRQRLNDAIESSMETYLQGLQFLLLLANFLRQLFLLIFLCFLLSQEAQGNLLLLLKSFTPARGRKKQKESSAMWRKKRYMGLGRMFWDLLLTLRWRFHTTSLLWIKQSTLLIWIRFLYHIGSSNFRYPRNPSQCKKSAEILLICFLYLVLQWCI